MPAKPEWQAITVRLFKGGRRPLATTTTAVGGYYQFTGLSFGDYDTAFDLPARYCDDEPATGHRHAQGVQGGARNFGIRSCTLLSPAVAPSSSG